MLKRTEPRGAWALEFRGPVAQTFDFLVSAISEAGRGSNAVVPTPHRYYGGNHLHYLTTSTYHRARAFDSERFKREAIATLAGLRAELDFKIIGYVLMPEHLHLLLWPSEGANPSQIMQKLEGRTARFILITLRANAQQPGAGRSWDNSGCPRRLITDRSVIGFMYSLAMLIIPK